MRVRISSHTALLWTVEEDSMILSVFSPRFCGAYPLPPNAHPARNKHTMFVRFHPLHAHFPRWKGPEPQSPHDLRTFLVAHSEANLNTWGGWAARPGHWMRIPPPFWVLRDRGHGANGAGTLCSAERVFVFPSMVKMLTIRCTIKIERNL